MRFGDISIVSDRFGATLTHHGEVRPLLTALAALELRDVRIKEVSLDEVFMDFYRDEAAS